LKYFVCNCFKEYQKNLLKAVDFFK
jgi:hypothetical protein